MVECRLGKTDVESPILSSGSDYEFAKVAQLVEHVFRKDGVAGSIPAFGSK